MNMRYMRRLGIAVLSSLLLALVAGTSSFAQEQFTVADVEMVLYTTSEGAVLSAPDAASVVIPKEAVEDGLTIQVTGITSNQFFRVNLGDGNVYYMAANGLSESQPTQAPTSSTSDSSDWPWNENNPYPIPDDEEPITETPIPESERVAIGALSPVGKTSTAFKYEYISPDGEQLGLLVPFVVNGIDIRNGDNDADGISENYQNTWYDGRIWIASNGVVIRVADEFYMNPGHMNVYSAFWDGTENTRPNSMHMLAFDEFTGRAYLTQISPADIPKVVPVSTKQTAINPSYPSFVAYKTAFDPLWQKQNRSSMSCLQPYNKNADGTANGIGLLSMFSYSGYMWTMDYRPENGMWILSIRSNYTELIWDSIHNSIRMVTPDADAVFKEVFESYYGGNSVLYQNGGDWVKLGNTHLMAIVNNGNLYYLIA